MDLLCCLTMQIQSSLYGKKKCMMLNGRFYAMVIVVIVELC